MAFAPKLKIQPPFASAGFPWAEFTSKQTGYTQSYSWATDNSQATWRIIVKWEDYVNPLRVIPAILGYSKRGSVGVINRYVPIAHPYFNWMYATSIQQVEGVGPKGIATVSSFGNKIAQYQYAIITIGFAALTYNVFTDSVLADFYGNDESNRYVTKLTDTAAEYIAIDRGTFKFASGLLDNPKGKAFNLGTGRITVKVDLDWIWHDVPEASVFSGNIPTNIYNCLGKVNNAEIWGFPIGTLLMLTPKFTPRNNPVSPLLMGVAGNGPPRSFDVRLNFKYWDPPMGPGNDLANGDRGHRTAMFVRDGLFYLIRSTNVGGADNGYLFQSADFTQIFKSL